MRWMIVGVCGVAAIFASVFLYGEQQRRIERQAWAARALAVPDTVRVVTQRTDTVVRTVQRLVTRIDSLVIPDTVRMQFPVVDTLVVVSDSLALEATRLTSALVTERATRDSALTLAWTARDHALADLRTRPSRQRMVWYVATGALLGVVVGALK